MKVALKATYASTRTPLERATDYLNSRFPFNKAESGLEVFKRVAAIMAPAEQEAVGMDFARHITEGTLPQYMEAWLTQYDEDYLHRPIIEK